MNRLIYTYDGTFYGLLSCIFEAYERKENPDNIYMEKLENLLFQSNRYVTTDEEKSIRVEKKLKSISNKTFKRILKAFYSEKENREIIIYNVVKLLIKKSKAAESDYGNEWVLQLKQIEKSFNREIHRMHAFVRFQLAKDKIWYAFVQPDFDVLTFSVSHFKERYADQKWIIFDLKREYGIYYDLEQLTEIRIDFMSKIADGILPREAMDDLELKFQQLWKEYFQTANISQRNNPKLHLRHVPKRYWHLLTEKQ